MSEKRSAMSRKLSGRALRDDDIMHTVHTYFLRVQKYT